MKLNAGLHLAYCTNVHRRETWAETFEALNRYTLRVRDRICPDRPYAIGLRLSNHAAHELNDRATLLEFQRWLGRNQCYVFTMNGFPYGQFHGLPFRDGDPVLIPRPRFIVTIKLGKADGPIRPSTEIANHDRTISLRRQLARWRNGTMRRLTVNDGIPDVVDIEPDDQA